MVHPSWSDVNTLHERESSAANSTDFDRKYVNGRSVGTGMDFDPPSRDTGTDTLLGWSIANGKDTGFFKHFKDCGIGTDTSTSSDSSKKVQDMVSATGTANLTGFLPPISESESELSLTGLPFKPRTFDDNLAFYFQEVGPLEEEKSVEEIFVSGQKSAVEFGIDMQRREGLRSLDWVRAQIMAEGTALTSSGLPIYGPRQFDSLPQEIQYS